MCLAIPARVTEILPDGMARVSLDGVTKIVSIAVVDDVRVGDFIVLHVGYRKIGKSHTPLTLAVHRSRKQSGANAKF
jgi:hydrogenase expression/formation protein HypC